MPGPVRLALGGSGPPPERDCHARLVRVAKDLELDLVARLVRGDRVAEFFDGGNLLAVGRDDDVAAEDVCTRQRRRRSVSPLRRPALSAPLPLLTDSTSTPSSTGSRYALASSVVIGWPWMPRYGCSTWPVRRSCPTTSFTVSGGTEKPIPTLPVLSPPVSIWVLTPMTSASVVEKRATRVALVDRSVRSG